MDYIKYYKDFNITPYQYFLNAVQRGDLKSVTAILQDPDFQIYKNMNILESALTSSVENNNIEIAKLLLAEGVDPKKLAPGFEPLHQAAAHNNLEMFKSLVEAGANMNQDSFLYIKPIHYALLNNSSDVANYIIENAIKSNIHLDSAAMQGPGIYERFMFYPNENSISLRKNYAGKTPLKLATEKGQLELIGKLIDLNGGFDHTIASESVRYASQDVIKIFADHGMKFTTIDLFSAALSHNQSAIKGILNSNIDLYEKDGMGATAMYEMAQFNLFDEMKLLLDNDVNPNAQNSNGDTPLHLALRIGNEAMARELLNHHADASIKNNAGITPTDLDSKGILDSYYLHEHSTNTFIENHNIT